MAMQQIVECNKGMVRDLEEQGQRHRYALQQAQQQAAAAVWLVFKIGLEVLMTLLWVIAM